MWQPQLTGVLTLVVCLSANMGGGGAQLAGGAFYGRTLRMVWGGGGQNRVVVLLVAKCELALGNGGVGGRTGWLCSWCTDECFLGGRGADAEPGGCADGASHPPPPPTHTHTHTHTQLPCHPTSLLLCHLIFPLL
jgi:hypothetical protein